MTTRILHGTRVRLEERTDGIRLILPPSGWISSGSSMMVFGTAVAMAPIWLFRDVWPSPARLILGVVLGIGLFAWGIVRSRRFVVLQVAGDRLVFMDGARTREWTDAAIDRLACREASSTTVTPGGRIRNVDLWIRLADGSEEKLVDGYDSLSLEHAATFVNKALGKERRG